MELRASSDGEVLIAMRNPLMAPCFGLFVKWLIGALCACGGSTYAVALHAVKNFPPAGGIL